MLDIYIGRPQAMVEKRLISSSGGQTDAGQLDAGETALFEIVPGYFDHSQTLIIESEGGGGFGEGRTQIALDPPAHGENWRFAYTIGHQYGEYSLRIAQGFKEWRLFLLCGPNAPLGEPGPPITYDTDPRQPPTTPAP